MWTYDTKLTLVAIPQRVQEIVLTCQEGKKVTSTLVSPEKLKRNLVIISRRSASVVLSYIIFFVSCSISDFDPTQPWIISSSGLEVDDMVLDQRLQSSHGTLDYGLHEYVRVMSMQSINQLLLLILLWRSLTPESLFGSHRGKNKDL